MNAAGDAAEQAGKNSYEEGQDHARKRAVPVKKAAARAARKDFMISQGPGESQGAGRRDGLARMMPVEQVRDREAMKTAQAAGVHFAPPDLQAVPQERVIHKEISNCVLGYFRVTSIHLFAKFLRFISGQYF